MAVLYIEVTAVKQIVFVQDSECFKSAEEKARLCILETQFNNIDFMPTISFDSCADSFG